MSRSKNYRCVLFDLDHTLWDYETNSREALSELYDRYKLLARSEFGFDQFFSNFVSVNNRMWDRYDRGEIQRDDLRTERFHQVLLASGIDDYDMSLKLSADYLEQSPKKKNLFPGAVEILEYLSGLYPLYIVTNGFDEIQSVKMASSGIHQYFKRIFTSEQIGHKKPSREIFDFVLNAYGHHASDAIMVGDNLLTDMVGARNANIDQVFFNPQRVDHAEPVTFEINYLTELRDIL